MPITSFMMVTGLLC